MRYLSVCSGIEAATVAWESIGLEAAAFSEIEKFPRDLLKHHYPDVPLHADFTTIKENEYGSVELLVGGTPCQDFSVAGLRRGLSGDRGNLTLEFIRLAQRLRPKWLVWENVPGVLSIDNGRAFGAFLGGLGECGYGVSYRVLDAQYFGVPQRRRRVFVVGCLGDWRSSAQVLFERESLCGDITPSRSAGQRTAGTLAQSSKASGGIGYSNQEIFPQRGDSLITNDDVGKTCSGKETFGTLAANVGSKQWLGNQEALSGDYHVFALAGNTIDRQPENGGNGLGFDGSGAAYTMTKVDRHAVAFPINTQLGLRGEASNSSREGIGLGNEGDPAFTLQSSHGHAVAFAQNQLGELHEGEVFNTLNTNSNASGRNTPLVRQTMQVRRLTPIECERLQGFPDDYTKISGNTADGPRYKALGNSMAVPVMRWIGEQIERASA